MRFSSTTFLVTSIAAAVVLCLLAACTPSVRLSDAFVGENAKGVSTQTKTSIIQSEQRLAAKSKDAKIAFALAQQYLQAVRESADVAYYDRIETLMKHVDEIEPDNPETIFLRGQIRMGRHDFAGALPYGERLVKEYPQVHRYYGLLADAQIEMGFYPQAVETLQTMSDIRPDASVLTRIAYVREIHGDKDGAIEIMRKVIDDPSPLAEPAAWSLSELGRLLIARDPARARELYEQALARYPDFGPALAGLARVAMAQGKPEEAIKQASRAFEVLPLPEHSALLADIYGASGDTVKAKTYETLTQAGYDAIAKGGTNVDLERSKFLSEHDLDPALALMLAENVYKQRQTVYAADALALALWKNGRAKESAPYVEAALRTGSKDSMILYHAGMIAKETGEKAKAAMYLNQALKEPYFSFVLAPKAREALRGL